jgi:hypothetical protein
MDWTNIWLTVVAVIAGIAGAFSAIASARSADLAAISERRVAATERQKHERELARTRILCTNELARVRDLLVSLAASYTTLFTFAGQTVSSGHDLYRKQVSEMEAEARELEKLAVGGGSLGPDSSDAELFSKILQMDETLITVQRLKEKALHDCGNVERQVAEFRSVKRASRPQN